MQFLSHLPKENERLSVTVPAEARPRGHRPSNLVIMIVEINVAGSQPVAPDKLFITRRSFSFAVSREHALYAHTHTFHILYRTPALSSEQI
jgi:hypothetical protein